VKLWKAVLVMNLGLLAGVLLGYLAWGRELPRLQRELDLARARQPVPGVEQVFEAQGVVRAVIREINVVVLTHEEIPGFMPAMTMGFRAQEARLFDGLAVGDLVRFTLKGVPPNMAITALARQGKT
jgi:Cu/Ag efflux protein CusF